MLKNWAWLPSTLFLLQFATGARAADPSITTPPVSQTVAIGSTVNFRATISGTPPFTYQWQFNGGPLTNGGGISGATASNLLIIGVQPSHAGAYRVAVTGPTNTAISAAAILTVTTNVTLAEALDTTGLVWITGGGGPWVGQTLVSHDGVDAAQSGTVPHNGSGSVVTTVTGPGTLTYWWKVSSETNNDALFFYLNGTAQSAISGEVNWQQRTVSVPAGSQALEWSYLKNAALSAGQDRAWVDQVQFVPSGGGTSAPCTFAISPTTATHNAGNSTGLVSVTTAAGCSWTVFNSNSWLNIISGATGTNNGLVRYFVTANTTAFTRIGHLLIAAQWFQVTQLGSTSAPPCSFTISPTNRNHGSGLSTNSVSVTTAAGCAWTVFNTNGWVSILSGSNGIGSGTVNYRVALNAGAARSGNVSIAGRNFAITQSGGNTSAPCTFAISPANATYSAASSTGLVSVSTSAGCSWTVENTNAWVAIISGASGNGNGPVVYRISENVAPVPRHGNLLVAGQLFAITQLARSTNTAISLAEALDTLGTSLVWGTTGTPVWFGQSSVSHDGVDAAQSGAVGHGAAVTVQTTVNGPGTISFWWKVSSETDKDYLKFFINGVQQLRISGEVDWESRSLAIPSGAQVLKWTYSKNASGSVGLDKGWLDQVQFLTTTGGCVITLSHASATHSSNSETGLVNVIAGAGCPWGVLNTNAWVTILSGANGSGGGLVRYRLTQNFGAARSGNLLIADQLFRITQLASPTNTTISFAEALDTVGTPLVWGTTGTPVWFGQSSVSHDGVDAAQSGAVGHGAAVTVQTTVNGPGTISFWWKVSSEANRDYLKFFINGVQQIRISGEADWELRSLPISAGTKILKWTYSKNESVSAGLDRGWLDQVRFLTTTGGCVITLSHHSAVHSSLSETGQVNVTAAAGCTWGVINTNSWITHVVGGGDSNGFVRYTLTANNSPVSRTGVIIIAGQPFTIVQQGGNVPCAYSISPTNRFHGFAATTGTVSVVAQAGCTWSVFNSNAWITILSGTNGSGNGQVNYSIAANTTSFADRTGVVTIAGQPFTIVQAFGTPPCTYTLLPTGQSYSYLQAAGQITVTAPESCAWNLFNSNAWVTIHSNLQSGGSGWINYTVSENTNSFARSGNIRVGNQLFFISQAAAPMPLAEALDIVGSPLRVWNAGYPAWVGQSNVTHDGVDAAQGSANGSFTLTVTGPGTLTFWWKVSSQTNSNARFYLGGSEQARLTGETDWQQQTTALPAGIQNLEWRFVRIPAGPAERAWVDQVQFVPIIPCAVTLSTTYSSHWSGSSTGLINVVAAPDCAWNVFNTNSWISILSGTNGTGNGTVTYIVAANPTASSRRGGIQIVDQIFLVDQGVPPPPGCTVSLSPTSASHGSGSSTGIVTVTASGCAWSAVNTNPWISILSATNGTGNGTVVYTVAPNNSSSPRSGNIRIGDQNFLVTQTEAVSGCVLSLSPASGTHGSGSETGTVNVAATPGCAWQMVNTNSWITILVGTNDYHTGIAGMGNGIVVYAVSPNNTGSARSGNIRIGLLNYLVTQSGASTGCIISISPSSQTFGPANATGFVSVATQTGCTWNVIETNTWITILSSLSNSSSGTLIYRVAPNTNSLGRSGTIRIGGQNFVVTQSGTSLTASNAAQLQFVGRPKNGATLSLQGEAGRVYVVECSEDFIHWIPISTNSAPATIIDVPVGDAPRRYYRTVENP